ncbi:MAG: carbamoyltransferase [Nanoarchaeota archaeon]|nr:carbamoyltransferase [Nanoarchaeota archaeon]
MYILWVSCFHHDASATLVKNGKIIAAVEEERFTRKKHDKTFPKNAIQYCLKQAGININQVKYVGFYEKPLLKFERVIYQHLQTFPKSLKTFVKSTPDWFTEKLRFTKILKKQTKYKGNVLFINHHMSHAASTFLPSPFKKAAILIIDGVGEWTTTSYGIGNKNEIELIKEIKFPHSIGLLYSTITSFLGFKINNDEYKVMGLAAYGNPEKYYDQLKKLVKIEKDGSFKLNPKYFSYTYTDKMHSKKLIRLLGKPRKTENEITQKHKNIAASLQKITEEIIITILKQVYKITKCESLVMAGGVALNSVVNGKILENTPFKKMWIQPNASDGGGSMGAALYISNTILNKKRNQLENAYYGPEYSTKQIKKFLDEHEIKYKTLNETNLTKTTAKLIHENKIIGWFQGRMEWGPRALGNRSILANPCNPEMKNVLNKKVKHRETFRPFAPAVCEEDAKKYFEINGEIPEPSKYMLMIFPVKNNHQKKIPAITHVDRTARPQIITKTTNPRYYELIKKFGKLSKTPILINTSFNVKGEPIVCTPQDAYNCFKNTGIDYLILNKFLIKKNDSKTT